jgi:pyrophosphatase PpaX
MAALDHPVWLFDFDGTLADTGELILTSWRYATERVLGRVPPDDELRAGIGLTLAEHTRTLGGDRADELFEVYVAHNQAAHRDLLRGFDGIPEMLARLRDGGARLGVVTAKIRSTLELGLDMLDLDRAAFEVIVAKEDTDRHKPDPAPILYALRELGAEPASAVYVGDSPYDLRAAHGAGVAAAAAMWGDIYTREQLLAERPDLVFESPHDIAAEVAA